MKKHLSLVFPGGGEEMGEAAVYIVLRFGRQNANAIILRNLLVIHCLKIGQACGFANIIW